MALLLLALLTACQGGPLTGRDAPPQKPRITIGSMNFAEQLVLAELYARALEARGYRVDRVPSLGPRETAEPALESGRIDLYPEYLATLLTFLTGGADRGSSDPAATHQRLSDVLKARGATAFGYAPAVNTNGFAVTAGTAQRYGLEKLSDLPPVAPQLIFGGPPECPVRPFCLPGLRQTYGITRIKDFRILDTGGPRTIEALVRGEVDVGLLFTTDPRIERSGLQILADDRGLQLADNVVPVARDVVASKAPADFRATLDAVSAQLTTSELTLLNAQVDLEARDPRDVASEWLDARGLLR